VSQWVENLRLLGVVQGSQAQRKSRHVKHQRGRVEVNEAMAALKSSRAQQTRGGQRGMRVARVRMDDSPQAFCHN
jgi:hypothetical protein